jgi:hypothetical protein
MPDPYHERLIDLLAGIDFGRRYYASYERGRNRTRWTDYTQDDLQAALATVPLDFTYHRREDFFRHAETLGAGLALALNVAFPASQAEYILDFRTPAGRHGAPYKRLAREVERRRDPTFTFDPPSPDLPFSSPDELREVVAFGTELYVEIREQILAAAANGAWTK